MTPLIGIAMSTDEQGFTLGFDYVRAIEAAGGVAVGIPSVRTVDRVLSSLGRIDGLLLSGGADIDPFLYDEEILPENGSLEPDRDHQELALARWAIENQVPLLGICRGMQVLNVALGGSLYQDIPSQTKTRLQHRQKGPRWYATHSIEIVPGSRLSQILGGTSARVNTFHHQAVRGVAPGLMASASASDGIIEAIEATDHPFAIGVQWHPEAMFARDPVQASIFAAFHSAAVAYGQTKDETRSKPTAGDFAV